MHDITNLCKQLNDPSLLKQQGNYGGKWRESKSGKRFDVTDPGSGKPWASAPTNDTSDVDEAVHFAHEAFLKYSKLPPRNRAKLLMTWYNLIEDNKDDIASVVTYETGKPLAEAKGELAYANGFTWWFSGEAERAYGTVSTPSIPGRRVFTIKQPVGVAAALVPWNFPIAMILRKCSAALAAGCTMVIKPSPETPLSVGVLTELALRAGFEPGVLNILTTDLENTPALSEALCKHELIKKVTFTGSTAVGKLIAKHCSEGLKKVTLELGGNCPFIVFDDADLDAALEALMLLKWRHAGQVCVSANRVFVQAGVMDKFTKMLVDATAKLKVGHGSEDGTTMGPLTTSRGVEKTQQHVEDAKKHGGKVLLGGNRPKGLEGYFFEPTIIGGATQEMMSAKEEVFGPMLALYGFQTEDEAVKLANNTSMGLATYYFTRDASRMWRLYENLEAGMLGMNTGNQSAAESPFGGIKQSGYGKESGKDVAIA